MDMHLVDMYCLLFSSLVGGVHIARNVAQGCPYSAELCFIGVLYCTST